uniref:Uncharacterized protein n=1 Tax=Anopheles farauti TaxID=69004 RepID=A0A182Q7B2_9DIPT
MPSCFAETVCAILNWFASTGAHSPTQSYFVIAIDRLSFRGHLGLLSVLLLLLVLLQEDGRAVAHSACAAGNGIQQMSPILKFGEHNFITRRSDQTQSASFSDLLK